MASIKFNFKNSDGNTLSGRLELPDRKPIAFAIFAHCFTCSKNILAASRIPRELTDQGIAVLRFDFTGLGNSEGDFSNSNFSSNVDDLISAHKALSDSYSPPQILIGHSLGGAAVLKASSSLTSIRAVITIGAPSDVHHVSHLFKDDLSVIEKTGEAKVNLSGREFKIKKQFLDDIKEVNLLNELKSSKKAFLIMHSPIDDTVSIDHASKIYSHIKHPKSFISLNKADHLISNPKDAEYIATVIGAWILGYLDVEDQDIDKPDEGKIKVLARQEQNFTQDIHSSKHHLIADEPRAFKGNDLGMNPYELLLSALGACTSMTIKMYARKKGIELKDVLVELSHEKEYHQDCEDCEGENGTKKFLDKITKSITLVGDLSDEQRKRILEISEKCPVNKTLKSETITVTKDG